MQRTFAILATLSGALLLPRAAVHAQSSYTYAKLGVPNQYSTQALELTDDGRVGGWATDFIHVNGFIENQGKYTTLAISGYGSTQITAISGSTVYGIVNENLGFSMDAKGQVTILRPSGFGALPNGTNSKGVVVGQTTVFQGNQPAFVLQNGTYKTFLVPNSNTTTFNAVNNLGVIVGTSKKNGSPLQSFMLANGQLSSVLFPGSYSTIASGINDAGEIVGWYYKTANGPLGLFRYDGSSYFDITLPTNSYACTAAHLNNGGSFVGGCSDVTSKQPFAFVATPAEQKEIQLPPQ